MLRVLIVLVSLGARTIRSMCRRRADLVIENVALGLPVTPWTQAWNPGGFAVLEQVMD